MTNRTEGRVGILVETDEAIRADDQIAHDSQSGKNRRIVRWDLAPLRAIGANMQFHASLAQTLKTGMMVEVDGSTGAVRVLVSA